MLAALNDPTTAVCVAAEREMVRRLDGDCHSPIAVLASIDEGMLHIRAAVGARDGGLPVISASAVGPAADSSGVVSRCWHVLSEQSVQGLLHGDR